jgi:hypothetical protein
VCCILGAGKAGLRQGEAGLHEHHQEARQQHPDEIEGHASLPHSCAQFLDGRHAGSGGGNVLDASRGTAIGVCCKEQGCQRRKSNGHCESPEEGSPVHEKSSFDVRGTEAPRAHRVRSAVQAMNASDPRIRGPDIGPSCPND